MCIKSIIMSAKHSITTSHHINFTSHHVKSDPNTSRHFTPPNTTPNRHIVSQHITSHDITSHHIRTVENVKALVKRRKLNKARAEKGAKEKEKRVSSFHRRSFRTPRTRGHPKTVKPNKAPCNIRQSSPTAHE